MRQEIDELLTSGRLERIETVSAHIFHMFGREWKEMTSYDILVHLFHDSLDDVDKLLARDRFKLIFNFVPLSASFTFTCLSRKFVRLSLNKFDRTAPAYGFGFTNLREMETFCAHLDRIRSYAKANLAPHLNATTLGLSNLSIRSPSSTPPRLMPPRSYADTPQRSFYRSAMQGYPSSQNSISTPVSEYAPSMYRSLPQLCSSYSRASLYEPPREPPLAETICEYELSYNTCVSYNHTFTDRAPAVTPATPLCQATDSDFQSVEPNRTVQQAIAPEEAQPVSAEDRLMAAELRVRALIDSVQPLGIIDGMWNNSMEQNADGSVTSSPRVSSLFENPAGVIGSPVKGKGGAYSCRGLDSTSPWKR